MNKSVASFVKGMGAGMAAAALVGVTGKVVMMNNKGLTRSVKKKVNRTARAIGDLVDNVQVLVK